MKGKRNTPDVDEIEIVPTLLIASTCGNNCAKWLLKIAEKEDRTVNLRNIMDFGTGNFAVHVINTDKIVHSMKELVPIAINYV